MNVCLYLCIIVFFVTVSVVIMCMSHVHVFARQYMMLSAVAYSACGTFSHKWWNQRDTVGGFPHGFYKPLIGI